MSPSTADPAEPTQAEEGERIGTLKQFADELDAPQWSVLQCVETHQPAIILSQAGGQPVFILDEGSLESIARCVED